MPTFDGGDFVGNCGPYEGHAVSALVTQIGFEDALWRMNAT